MATLSRTRLPGLAIAVHGAVGTRKAREAREATEATEAMEAMENRAESQQAPTARAAV
jgi:hypothetical protein